MNYNPKAKYCFVLLLCCFCCPWVQLTSFPIILMDGGTVEPETTAPMPVDAGCGSCSTRSDSESKLILTCDQRCVSFRWSWFFLVKVLPSSLFSSASCVFTSGCKCGCTSKSHTIKIIALIKVTSHWAYHCRLLHALIKFNPSNSWFDQKDSSFQSNSIFRN